MFIYKVQDCGCIALPEELQRLTGLNPGATFQVHIAEDCTKVILHSIEKTDRSNPSLDAACATQANRV